MAQDRGTIERIVAALSHIAAAEDPVRVSTMAAALDLPQSTAHRLINHFVRLGILRRTPGTRHYERWIEAFRLGASLSRRLNPVVELAMPSLHRIVQVSKESCALGLYSETDASMFFAAQIQSPQPLRYYVNLFTRESVLWGTSGRVILAHLSPDMPKMLLKNDPVSPTGLRPPQLKILQEELAQVREHGFAISNRGERVTNASGIATPIFAAPGRVIGCLTLSTPSFRYSKQREPLLVSVMTREAKTISAEMRG